VASVVADARCPMCVCACVCVHTCPASPAWPVREGERRARGAETGERGRDGREGERRARGAETGEKEFLQALTDPMISIRTRSDEMGTRSVCTDAQRAVTLCVPRATSFVQRIRSSLLLSGHGSP
jgi:hypothetical protein